MKTILSLCMILFSTTSFAFQCPSYSDFSQDKENVWHLTKIPPAPNGTYWKPLTQGPLAPHNHKVDSIDVQLTYGTYPDRIHCSYGKNGNIYMGVELHVSENQMPIPGPGAPFEDSDCLTSPEACTFDVKA